MNWARPLPGRKARQISLPPLVFERRLFLPPDASGVLVLFCGIYRFISSPLPALCFKYCLALGAPAGEGLDGKVGDRKMRLIQVDGEKIRHILSELVRTARGTLKRAAGSDGSLG